MKNEVLSKLESQLCIGKGVVNQQLTRSFFARFSTVVLVSDQNVFNYWGETLLALLPAHVQTVILAAGEQHKNLESVQQIWGKLIQQFADRQTLVVALGGGAVLDLAGFAAATYMRGIGIMYLPTTLLAQSDACLGAKVGFNYANKKNLIGSFSSPNQILCDLDFLTTLPARELKSGFAEIIKHGFIGDANLLDQIVNLNSPLTAEQITPELIQNSLTQKNKIISLDFKDHNLRMALNFGHTAGHAFEMLSLKSACPLLHGEAIALGMLYEMLLSQVLLNLPRHSISLLKALLAHCDLPTSLPFKIELSDFLQQIKGDKKQAQGHVKWALLEAPQKIKINAIATNEEISSTFKLFLEQT